ncbi:MAG: cyclic nucleotide-binding domain-containing protein [Gammaproteobacteria bacterium]
MISKAEMVKTLGKAELFANLNEQTLEAIAGISQVRHFDENEILYRPGDDSRDVYVLLSGRVRFTLYTGAGSRSSGSVMSSRMVFGWAALVSGQPRRLATSEAIEPSTVLSINGDDLLKVIEQDPASGFVVMQRVAAMIARNFMEQES